MGEREAREHAQRKKRKEKKEHACEVLRQLSHDANQPIRKFRSPDERWKSSKNRLSLLARALVFFFATRVLALRARCRASRLLNAPAPVVQAISQHESLWVIKE